MANDEVTPMYDYAGPHQCDIQRCVALGRNAKTVGIAAMKPPVYARTPNTIAPAGVTSNGCDNGLGSCNETTGEVYTHPNLNPSQVDEESIDNGFQRLVLHSVRYTHPRLHRLPLDLNPLVKCNWFKSVLVFIWLQCTLKVSHHLPDLIVTTYSSPARLRYGGTFSIFKTVPVQWLRTIKEDYLTFKHTHNISTLVYWVARRLMPPVGGCVSPVIKAPWVPHFQSRNRSPNWGGSHGLRGYTPIAIRLSAH